MTARVDWEDIDTAAPKLMLTSCALRARCRRAARKVGRDIVADLGMGVIAKKLGSSWRVYVPPVAKEVA